MPRKNETPAATVNPDLIKQVTVRDRVYILTPQNQVVSGRAVMPSSHGGWVLDMGGRHGTPGIADATNIVRVVRKK